MTQLDIIQFIQQNANIEQTYVDKFWSNISDTEWIYIDNELLEWIGYERNTDIYRLKHQYLELLLSNFDKDTDFKHITSPVLRDIHKQINITLPANINIHNSTKHIIVHPDCFKESLMIINTNRSKMIRKYYIQLEKIFIAYIKHCEAQHKKELEETKQQLIESKQSITQFKLRFNKKNEYKLNQYIYVATSRNYAKDLIFKVGMTKHIDKRICSYQTGRCNDDKFVYVYIARCFDCKSLEQTLQVRLDQFRHDDSRELFQIHFNVLKSIIDEFVLFEEAYTPKLNHIINTYYDTYENMQIPSFEELIITDMDDYIDKKYNTKIVEPYRPPTTDEVHPRSLTDEEVNKRLEPYGLKLKEPYNGRCDAHNTFECTSVLNHTIVSTLEHVIDNKQSGCVYCGKMAILDQIPIYVYKERTYEYVCSYPTFDDLKKAEPMVNHQLLRNIIREQRWLTPHYGHIYSILAPEDNKLILMKTLTEAEKFIINKLDIDYEIMRSHTMKTAMTLIIAIDDINGVAYSGSSATEYSKRLCYVNSGKRINRKTVSKYIDADKKYGGYKWISSLCAIYNGVPTIDITTLPMTS